LSPIDTQSGLTPIPVTRLDHYRFEIIAAIDFLLTGI